MKTKVLVLGGSKFVSSRLSKFFNNDGFDVTILNRGKHQRNYEKGINTIFCDRNDELNLKELLKEKEFDYIIDCNAYNKKDIEILLNSLNIINLKCYFFISSGAVYSDEAKTPYSENSPVGYNSVWKDYGLNKLYAEQKLMEISKEKNIDYVILRPPYLYGGENNLLREAFIFSRQLESKAILVPNNGETKLQFFHIKDLYLLILNLINKDIVNITLNCGNEESITFLDWINECLKINEKDVDLHFFDYKEHGYIDRDFFPFYDNDYHFDVSKMKSIYKPQISMNEGLIEAYNVFIKYDYIDDKKLIYDKTITKVLNNIKKQ